MEERIIKLPSGLDLEVQVTDKFIEIVKEYFSLASVTDVTDDHVRHYIFESMNTAVKKVEKEIH